MMCNALHTYPVFMLARNLGSCTHTAHAGRRLRQNDARGWKDAVKAPSSGIGSNLVIRRFPLLQAKALLHYCVDLSTVIANILYR